MDWTDILIHFQGLESGQPSALALREKMSNDSSQIVSFAVVGFAFRPICVADPRAGIWQRLASLARTSAQ